MDKNKDKNLKKEKLDILENIIDIDIVDDDIIGDEDIYNESSRDLSNSLSKTIEDEDIDIDEIYDEIKEDEEFIESEKLKEEEKYNSLINKTKQEEKEVDFCHLHLHTEYSLLDASGKIKKLVKKAKELGMKSMAITDHGVMYGCIEFYKACKEEGIKPIIGCEIYVCSRDMDDKTLNDNSIHHLVLLVKNEVGYSNLIKIVSEASIRGFYYKPRVDHAFLKEHSEGLICLSACLGGEVQENFNHGNFNKAKEAAIFYRDTFKDGFYLELQDHGLIEQKKVNKLNIDLAKELNIPLVCTNDVHYIEKEDYKAHDILLCIQTVTSVDEADRRRYPSHEFYLKSGKQMKDLFKEIPEAIENTVKIADECNYDYEFHVSKLPEFKLPKGVSHIEYLRGLTYRGVLNRYEVFSDLRSLNLSEEELIFKMREHSVGNSKELIDRLEYELGILESMGYVDYFLIVWDFIKYANDHGIATGAGRGSAAASIIAYSLNITKIDPIKYSLIFERFLNPERVSMPDIDSDFCYERRQEVIDYVVSKYGINNVSQIITFGTMAAKACIRDVGRAMGYPYGEVDQIAKMIPTMLNITIDKALELNPEFKNSYDNDKRVKDLIDIARKLEGLPRHTSTHAAGVVISGKELVEYVPLQKNDESIVTQFPMGTLEELGLLKMDFLGLRTLTVMQDAVEMVKKNKRVDVDLDALDFNDENIYKMISEGKTVGVFQLESPGMTAFMKELKPESLEDIIAGISLYRPGPMAEIPRYVAAKRNPEKVVYETSELEHILDVTYGVMVYQEQVMQIVRDLAGYSLGRADMVRRAMSKKKHEVMIKERQSFIDGIVDENGNVIVPGTRRNGIDDNAANKIFDQMVDFASYAFNKAHAAAYAVIGYQTGYLMRYYPIEFLAAMLNSFIGDPNKANFYIRYAKSIGANLLPPDINESYSKFTVNNNNIRFGLGGIKNLGFGVINHIIEVRSIKGKFTSFNDFMEKIDTSMINKRAIESMIKAGAFDSLGVFRSRLLAVFERILDSYSNERKKMIKGQVSFFSMLEGDSQLSEMSGLSISMPELDDFGKMEKLQMEKEMTGLYLSGHPLDEYEKDIKAFSNISVEDLIDSDMLDDTRDEAQMVIEKNLEEEKIYDGMSVTLGGIISSLNVKITKNSTMMAFLNIEDLTGIAEVIVFPKTYNEVSHLLKEDNTIALKGRLQIKEDENAKIIAEQIIPLEKGELPTFKERFTYEKRGNISQYQGKKDSVISISNNNNNQNNKGKLIEDNTQKNNGTIVKYNDMEGKNKNKEENNSKLYLRFDNLSIAKTTLKTLGPLLKAYKGNMPVYIFSKENNQAFLLNENSWIEDSIEIIGVLNRKLGEDNVKKVQKN